MAELALLQAVRFKGRLTPDLAAASNGTDPATAASALDDLREAGYVEGDSSVRLTPQGRERLAALVADERSGLDRGALASLYDEFDRHNTQLKQIVSDWQLRDGAPNGHDDASYDQAVIDRLCTLDYAFQPIVARIVDLAPRLQSYPSRFANAIEQVRTGDTAFVARPITDSYHTVWFELHEELIGLLGRRRDDEAAAGRAV